MMRIGAPLAKVPTAADTPAAVAISMLPPITAWIRAGLDVKDLEVEPVLLENAGALAELGDAGVPGAALRDRDFQGLLRPGDAARARDDRKRGKRRDECCPRHCCSSRGSRRGVLQRRRQLYEPIAASAASELWRNWARQVDDRRWMMALQRERTERCPSAERSIHPRMCSRTSSPGRKRRRSAGWDARLKQRSLRWPSSTPITRARH